MSDDDPDPGSDPLAGRNPHPRDRIDLWPLRDARQELLEEIVSQSGPGDSPARTARSRALLSVVGIAAALALVIGGAWAVTNGSGDDGKDGQDDDQVVAASSDAPDPSGATDPTTDATTEATEATAEPTDEPEGRRDRRKDAVRIGDARTLRECLVELDRSRDGTGKVGRVRQVVEKRGRQRWTFYVVRDSGQRYLVIGDDCARVRVVPDKPRRRP